MITNQKERNINDVLERTREFCSRLQSCFVCRDVEVELMLVAAIAQEPLLFIGPPGTGKSGLVTQFKEQLALEVNEYFEYMLTKFTEPSELLGPLDLKRMKIGEYYRKTSGKLPEAKVVFLDEIFKSNSAILNTLLTILNEKKFYQDGKPHPVPLKILFAATNELPSISELDALKDRFTLKVYINKVPEDKWDQLLQKGLKNESSKFFGVRRYSDHIITLEDLEYLHQYLQHSMREMVDTGTDKFFSDSLRTEFKRIIKTILHDYEIEVTDRKLIKLYKLVRARALLKRGGGVERDDFSLMMHLGNQEEEIEFLKKKLGEIVG
jgi:MoxR-like ATPase